MNNNNNNELETISTLNNNNSRLDMEAIFELFNLYEEILSRYNKLHHITNLLIYTVSREKL